MNLDTLEKLADAATPGPWSWYEWDTGESHVVEANGDTVTRTRYGSLLDHKFIAAANPATIKSLIALCRIQNEALKIVATGNIDWLHKYVEAIVAYELFNKGE